MKKQRLTNIGLALSLGLLGLTATGQAGETTTVTTESEDKSLLSEWWNGKNASGNWFGVRDTLEDHGIKLGIEWKANFLWNVDGGRQQRFGFDDEWKFRGTLDFAKLTGVEALEGLTFYSDVRYRGGSGVNKYVGTGNTGQFAPSTFQGGRLWRFQNAYFTYTTPELFGVKDFFTLSGGWQNPTDIFVNQPLNKFFLNNTFTSNRGFGANGFGWGGSFAAWGGYAKVKPGVDWAYVQSGLYLAVPGYGTTSNHGLYFAGANPPDSNGIYWLTEAGVTPKIGPSKLPGRYAAGFMYWGVENTSYFGATYDQRVLLYWQADQQLFREPTPEAPAPLAKGPSDGKEVADAKSFKGAIQSTSPKLSDQGLYFFSLINFAPKYNNPEPFYFHTGLVYKGLIPTRDNDQFGVAFAYGNYSYYKQLADERAGRATQTYEGVVEFSYRIQINKWAYVQPDLQYIIRPGATGNVANATVLGFQLGVTF